MLAVGRRRQALDETASLAAGSVSVASADVATDAGRAQVADALPAEAEVRFLVHGAGVYPIAPVEQLSMERWRDAVTTNVEARLFLTTLLLPRFAPGARVLFIGSDSATRPRKGATAYCVTKAASFMLEECLKLELAESGISVTNARPGLVATAMVAGVISADPAVMPDQQLFAAARDGGRLISPDAVGRFFKWLLVDIDDERYSGNNWDIRDTGHHHEWLGDGALYA